MSTTRRTFLTAAAALGFAAASPYRTVAHPARPKKRIKLGISTYSYWHFTPNKIPIETVIDQAAELGVEGVDVLHRQMESEDGAYLQKLKRHAFLNGVSLICSSEMGMLKRFAGMEGLGKPHRLAETDVEEFRRFLRRNLPDGVEVPIRSVVLFIDPDAKLDIKGELPVPVFRASELKRWLRRDGRRGKMPENVQTQLYATLGIEM